MNATLKKGYGYWDVTQYPYGGCFRRAAQDTPVQLTGETDKKCGSQFRLGERTCWTMPEALLNETS